VPEGRVVGTDPTAVGKDELSRVGSANGVGLGSSVGLGSGEGGISVAVGMAAWVNATMVFAAATAEAWI